MSAWAWKTASRTLKYLSFPAQRAMRKLTAATLTGSVRNSRNTYRTRPVSTYLALKAGKMSLLKWAQWVQLAEPYSITVTGALGFPRLISASLAGAAAAGRGAGGPRAAPARVRRRLCRGGR